MASYVPGCEDQGKALQRQALQRTESVPGGSPCSFVSETGFAMEYTTSTCSTPPPRQLQNSLNESDGSEPLGTGAGGWFSKCRGCGCMTAHEQQINGADVPFCRRCQVTLDSACPRMRTKMIGTLLYVHQAWSSAGL